MAPSTAKLKAALKQGTRDVYEAEPDGTSVNQIRRHVEQKLGLEDGFFTAGSWKQMSKELIKEQMDELLDEAEPESEAETKAAKTKSPEPKRRKRASNAPTKKTRTGRDDDDGLDEDDGKTKINKTTESRSRKAVADSDEEPEDQASPPPAKKRKRDIKARPGAELEGNSDGQSDGQSEVDVSGDEKGKDDSGVKASLFDAKVDAEPEEDEYSDVIDEAPPVKSKKKEAKAAPSASKSKGAKPAASRKATSGNDDPNEAEIKKLQSQLTKCGVRKLWHNELKQYGDDAKAKIRHLRKMLTGVGMDGRFSEAKAREIKEMRELQADVEAAQEMDKLWGMKAGGRASRSKSRSKSAKAERETESGEEGEEEEEEEEEEEDAGANGRDGGETDEDEDKEPTSFAARRRKAHADLAFLGDESDSD